MHFSQQTSSINQKTKGAPPLAGWLQKQKLNLLIVTIFEAVDEQSREEEE